MRVRFICDLCHRPCPYGPVRVRLPRYGRRHDYMLNTYEGWKALRYDICHDCAAELDDRRRVIEGRRA